MPQISFGESSWMYGIFPSQPPTLVVSHQICVKATHLVDLSHSFHGPSACPSLISYPSPECPLLSHQSITNGTFLSVLSDLQFSSNIDWLWFSLKLQLLPQPYFTVFYIYPPLHSGRFPLHTPSFQNCLSSSPRPKMAASGRRERGREGGRG